MLKNIYTFYFLLFNISLPFISLSKGVDSTSYQANKLLCNAQFYYIRDSCNHVSFISSGTTPGDTTAKFEWNFGDGQTSHIRNPIHSYSKFGVFNACLKVFRDSCFDNYCDSVYLSAPKNVLAGQVFLDSNRDGIKQKNEAYMNDILIQINPGPYILNSKPYSLDTFKTPNYLAKVGTGDFLIQALIPKNWKESIPHAYFHQVNFPDDSCAQKMYGLNFGIYPNDSINEATVSIERYNTPRPGKNIKYQIAYKNTGGNVQSGTISMSYDNKELFLTATPSPQVNSPTKYALSWNFINLLPLECRTIDVTFAIPIGTAVNDSLFNRASVFLNNSEKFKDSTSKFFIVKNNNIPNEKTVSPAGDSIQGFIKGDQELTYVVRFKNPYSNSISNLRIIDTLDNKLDPTTISLIGTSHPYKFELINNHILIWNFSNISLSDSITNDENSQGFIKFSIKPKAIATNGDKIINKAAIYFKSSKKPVFTNSTINTIRKKDIAGGLKNKKSETQSLRIYPQPMESYSLISFPNNASDKFSFRLIDFSGKLIWNDESHIGSEYIMQRGNLKSGIYLIQILTESKQYYTGKLIVQ